MPTQNISETASFFIHSIDIDNKILIVQVHFGHQIFLVHTNTKQFIINLEVNYEALEQSILEYETFTQ